MSNQPDLFPPMSAGGTDDILIVGGGLAGLFCALKLAPKPVTVITAAPIGTGASSAWAQAGIAAAVSPGDTVAKHLEDTVAAGAGIVDEAVAELMVSQAADRIHDLLEFGVPFDRDLEGKLVASREAAHSERRVVGVQGDRAGRVIMESLIAAVRNTPSIRVVENVVAEEFVMDGNRIAGLLARPEGGLSPHRLQLKAQVVVMASGGTGHLFAITTNPEEARGGGCGMAARAGAVIADPEFVQFHPTAINVGKDPAPLATEALRGEGAVLLNDAGERFMLDIDPAAELAPRDVVARGIFEEVEAGRGAWLDCREAIGKHFDSEFPTVYRYCQEAGIDPETQLIPVIPAAHYHMGGILTDVDGRTSIDGLYACGEVTSTGAHGANRLASNSLLEAVVFAARIADDVSGRIATETVHHVIERLGTDEENHSDEHLMPDLRAAMSRHVGVSRNAEGLKEALQVIKRLEDECRSTRFLNALTTAKLMTVAALNREESRGGHFRRDFPDADPQQQQRTFIRLAEADERVAELVGEKA